jgi:hypothetical protein
MAWMTARRGAAGIGVMALVAAVMFGGREAGAARPAAVPKLGHWTSLSATGVLSGTPAVWEDFTHHATVLWEHDAGTTFTYDAAQIAPTGTPGATTDIFAGNHWASLSSQPSLVEQEATPLVIFSGIQGSKGNYSLGCIYGASATTQPWTLAQWSMSHDCAHPDGRAGENNVGTPAAAWPGSQSVQYRIGTSQAIPATSPDSSFPVSANGTVYKTGVAADTGGSDDFYIAWAQTFSNPATHDGYYVKDVTSGAAAVKAPGSNTNSINRLGQFANLAITSRDSGPGVYIAYCTGTSGCHLKLWRVGATSAMSLPSTPNPGMVSISSGPGGRIWVAWFDENTLKVYVTRSNEKVSRFGPVRSYRTSCVEHGLLGLASGTYGRLDIALQCLNASVKAQEFATQVEVGLHLSANPAKVSNTSAHTITMTVTDAGDPVSGAKVTFRGASKLTNSNGKASFTLPKHTTPKTYTATATKSQYLHATTTVKVTS